MVEFLPPLSKIRGGSLDPLCGEKISKIAITQPRIARLCSNVARWRTGARAPSSGNASVIAHISSSICFLFWGLPWLITLTFNPWKAIVMTHAVTQKTKVNCQSIQQIEWKQTEDTTKSITVNAVGNYYVLAIFDVECDIFWTFKVPSSWWWWSRLSWWGGRGPGCSELSAPLFSRIPSSLISISSLLRGFFPPGPFSWHLVVLPDAAACTPDECLESLFGFFPLSVENERRQQADQ